LLRAPVIAHRGAGIGVPGGDLHVAQVHPGIQHRGDKRMPEHMRMRPADGHSGGFGEAPQAPGGGGEVDRSPCGSGTCARLAVFAAGGRLPTVIPQVTGTAYRTGEHLFSIDPHDPLVPGFVLR
jgi:Proline racemase